MAGNLANPDGLIVTLQFGVANVEANTTTALTLAQGGAGLLVPTGYAFHAMLLQGGANAALNAGGATFRVTANTVAVTNGPTAVLDANTQTSAGSARPLANVIAAGQTVGVQVVTDANFAPNTVDVDAVLSGVLLPA